MKKIFSILLLSISVAAMAGCGKQNIQKEMQTGEHNVEGVAKMTDYSQYEGEWAVNGASHADIIVGGGTEMSCSIENENEFFGSIFTQQGSTERFASIENITGVIENDEMFFAFEDDGWGGKGTVHVLFQADKITIEILDYQMAENNQSGYGISGRYEMIRRREQETVDGAFTKSEPVELSYDEMLDLFYEQFYTGLSDAEIEQKVEECAQYYHESKYSREIMNYWEKTRGVTDISNMLEPLYFTDMKYYSEDDFRNDSKVVIRLAKNEIYARHGYIFSDEDLNHYFKGCVWYQPVCTADEFDDTVFNDYERKNLELLVRLEKE